MDELLPSAVVEVGDLLFTLAAFANQRRIRLDDAIARAMEKYAVRDGAAWQQRDRP
jgi:NTP pyrophosphatase (non-canonical NTP hydrolase)